MLVQTEKEIYDKILDASRFEYFSASGPGLIRLIQPFIKERLNSNRSDVFVMRISLLLPWSIPITEMTRKEVNVSNPTRRAPISDEVISNFGEFLELPNYLEKCTSRFIFTFECYDCFPFFKYAFVENNDEKAMCLKNYMNFTKGSSTVSRGQSADLDIEQQHYGDAQRVIQEFGFKIAETSNLYGKIKTSVHFHLLKDMNPKRFYRIESGKITEYEFKLSPIASSRSGKPDDSNDLVVNKSVLLQVLAERLSDDELRTLCFSLNVHYDELTSEGKTGRLRELIMVFERRNAINKLLDHVTQFRPDIDLTTVQGD